MPPPSSPEELALARRAWRLGVLTTGDLSTARRALSLLPPQPAGSSLDADRLDRLAIQSLRRAVGPQSRPQQPHPSAPPAETPPAAPQRRIAEPISLGPAHDILSTLPLQAAEAFVLRRLDDLDPIRACRAMDCSRSAADRFLERSEHDMARRLGPALDAALAQLRSAADAITPDAEVIASCTARARKTARTRLALLLSITAATLAALLLLASALV